MHKILLVDDERWVRTALRKTIEKVELPFQIVHESTNGIEAIDWLRSHEVDLVITDIRMPVMDGLVFIEQLIGQSNNSASVIIVSGHDDFSYAQQAIRMGAFDYLLKPVEVGDMRNCLVQWQKKKNQDLHQSQQVEINYLELSPIEQILQHIEDAMPGDFTLNEVAAKVHLNASYVSQLFKQKMNRNFTDYITERRMMEAAHLLKITSLRVSEIAERIGFKDLAYFSNSFKKWSGKTPSQYRKYYEQL